jgi:phospholipid/cholesterol/gamma-HCH transport system permease protein
MSNVAGIFGGMLAAYFYLDITPEVFFNRISEAFRNIDLITGLIKSIVFILLIIITGSFYGLQVKRGAAGVGRMTTKAVVVSISLVIIADSLIGLLFY